MFQMVTAGYGDVLTAPGRFETTPTSISNRQPWPIITIKLHRWYSEKIKGIAGLSGPVAYSSNAAAPTVKMPRTQSVKVRLE